MDLSVEPAAGEEPARGETTCGLPACHVVSSDNIIPFSKPGRWISTSSLFKALLKDFYFISAQFYCIIDGII